MRPLPLSKRPIDIALIVFFGINLFFITYMVDLEQLVIADPDHFHYPGWPPAAVINVAIILFEEVDGEHATPELGRVLLSNAAWVIFPLIVLWRMWRSVYPFSDHR